MKTRGKACPLICDYVHPGNPNARAQPGINDLKLLADRLAREDITRDMEEVLRETEDNQDKANNMEEEHRRKT